MKSDVINSEEFHKLEDYYKTKTVLDIFGISRYELAYSSFIAWILDPNESHGLGEYAIRRFIELFKNDQNFDERLKKIEEKECKIKNVCI